MEHICELGGFGAVFLFFIRAGLLHLISHLDSKGWYYYDKGGNAPSPDQTMIFHVCSYMYMENKYSIHIRV